MLMSEQWETIGRLGCLDFDFFIEILQPLDNNITSLKGGYGEDSSLPLPLPVP